MFSKALGPLLLVATVACYSWKPQAASPDTGALDSTSGLIRVSLVDGSRVAIYGAEIANDTLRGWDVWNLDNGRRVPIAVPVSQIRLVETRYVSTGKSIAIFLAIMVPLGVVAAVAAANLGSLSFPV